MDKSRSEVVGFLYKVFPLYFPAGESALAKKMPGLEKVKERREKKTLRNKYLNYQNMDNVKNILILTFHE